MPKDGDLHEQHLLDNLLNSYQAECAGEVVNIELLRASIFMENNLEVGINQKKTVLI